MNILFSFLPYFLNTILGLVFLSCGTFFLLFVERFFSARVQHRDGPGRGGETNYYQVLYDFFKINNVEYGKKNIPFRFQMIFWIWKIMPLLFISVMITGISLWPVRNSELALLFLLMTLSPIAEMVLVNATTEEKEKMAFKQSILARAMGMLGLFFSVLPLVLRAGSFDLSLISKIQSQFPFHAIFMSPGIFLASLTAFFCVYLICGVGPIRSEDDLSILGAQQYTFFIVKRMWIFCLLAFWVLLFGGGIENIFSIFFYVAKIVLVVFIFYLLEISVPRIRSANAESMVIRWLLPLSLLAFAFEVLWMGGFR